MPINSFVFIITYTLNYFLLVDLDLLKKSGNFRFAALVDERLKTLFLPYEALFDKVYYISVTFFNVFFIESFPQEAELAIEKELLINPVIKLVSFFEGDIEATAKLRDRFGIPGLGYKQARLFRNKLEMKKILSSCAILFPKGFHLDLTLPCEDLFNSCEKQLGLPFIVKPVCLVASIGVLSINSYDQFHQFYLEHIDTPYMAEKKIQGDLYHLDAVVSKGTVKWFGCSQYNLPNMEFMQNHPIGSMPLLPKDNTLISDNQEQTPDLTKMYDLHERFRTYLLKVSKCFHFEEGIFHIEVFKTSSDIYFLETAARPPGSLVMSIYKKMFGYNPIQASLHYLAGLEYTLEKPEGLAYFWACFSSEEEANRILRKLNISYQEIFVKSEKPFLKENLGGQHYRALAYENDYIHLKKKFFALGNV